MKAYFYRFVLFCIFYVYPTHWASATTYEIVNYPALQNGLTVSGSISAVDSNNDTVLDPGELSWWTLTIDDRSVNISHPDAASFLMNVSITDRMIFLEDPSVSGLEEQLILSVAFDAFVNYYNAPFSSEYNDQIYNGRYGSVPSPEWVQQTTATDGPNLPMPVGNGRIIIARVVPEPGTLTLLIVGFILSMLTVKAMSRRSTI